MIALLIANGSVLSRHALMEPLLEVAENGLRIVDALRRGERLILRDPEGHSEHVAMPIFA